MITTKTCNTCEHYPNDKHCIGCVWDESNGENTKWELKKNPIVIERKVLDKIRAEIVELWKNEPCATEHGCLDEILQIIDKYKAESEE